MFLLLSLNEHKFVYFLKLSNKLSCSLVLFPFKYNSSILVSSLLVEEHLRDWAWSAANFRLDKNVSIYEFEFLIFLFLIDISLFLSKLSYELQLLI